MQLGAGTRQALPGAPPLIRQAIGAGTVAEAAGRAEHGADEEAAAVSSGAGTLGEIAGRLEMLGTAQVLPLLTPVGGHPLTRKRDKELRSRQPPLTSVNLSGRTIFGRPFLHA